LDVPLEAGHRTEAGVATGHRLRRLVVAEHEFSARRGKQRRYKRFREIRALPAASVRCQAAEDKPD
jgi:hypothetical protein